MSRSAVWVMLALGAGWLVAWGEPPAHGQAAAPDAAAPTISPAGESTAPAAAPATTPAGTTPLGVRQQRVERLMEDLERKFRTLQQAIGESEPERAAKLKETYEKAKEMLLQQRMGDITKMLDQARLDTAVDGQKEVLADIRTLLEILLDEKSDKDKNREEFERLSEWKKQIEELITKERGEKRESDKVAAKDETLAALQAKIQALETVIAAQKKVLETTEASRAAPVETLGKIAGEQTDVRKKAEAIANQIAKEAGDEKGPYEPKDAAPSPMESAPAAGTGEPQAGKLGEPKPGEAKPGEGKPGAGKPGEGKPGEGQPGAGKPGEGQPGSGQPGNGQPGSGQPGEGSPAGEQPPAASSPPRPSEPGEKPLQQAIENQQAAEQKLLEGKGKAASDDEKTAVANLERALAELKREQARIASLPPEAFEKMAQKQDDISNQTAKLEQKMQEAGAAGGKGGEGGEGQAGGGGKPQPGQQKVQQAQKSMQQASGGLRKQDPSDAARRQAKSIKELQEALQEIEERLAQLREETQLEKLARLEQRFREMLARQQKATLDTAVFEKKRQESGELKRTDRLALGKVAVEEGALAESAQQALDIILDDGTSVVFPDVVAQVRDDMLTVKQLLESSRTDAFTNSLQKEIESTLEELIEALQQAQSQKEGSGGGGGGGGGEPPLFPNSAELKLLRAAQMRINRRTTSVATARAQDAPLDENLKNEVQTIANRQSEIAEMTIRILERAQ
jgi:DNA repair exonuclease SbcCD ATPase subunit